MSVIRMSMNVGLKRRTVRGGNSDLEPTSVGARELACVEEKIPETSTSALYRLMTWLSPAYPVGAFSYSGGLEWAIEAGDITDAATLAFRLPPSRVRICLRCASNADYLCTKVIARGNVTYLLSRGPGTGLPGSRATIWPCKNQQRSRSVTRL